MASVTLFLCLFRFWVYIPKNRKSIFEFNGFSNCSTLSFPGLGCRYDNITLIRKLILPCLRSQGDDRYTCVAAVVEHAWSAEAAVVLCRVPVAYTARSDQGTK